MARANNSCVFIFISFKFNYTAKVNPQAFLAYRMYKSVTVLGGKGETNSSICESKRRCILMSILKSATRYLGWRFKIFIKQRVLFDFPYKDFVSKKRRRHLLLKCLLMN